MKKSMLFFIVLFLLVLFFNNTVAQSTVLSLGGSAAGICSGPVDITIDVSDIPTTTPLQGYDVRVSYDPASVNASAVFEDSFFDTSGAIKIRNAVCGTDSDFGIPTCAFAVAQLTPSSVSGSGTLATITLTNAGPIPSTLDFYISGALTPKFSDPNGDAIPITLGASVDVPGCPTGNDDYGDHLDSYDTLNSSDGPFHGVFPDTNSDGLPNNSNGSPAIWLGNLIDTESDGIPSANADGDDNNNDNDEDGVVPFQPQFWAAGTNTGRVDVSFNSDVDTGNSAWLAIWFDWNNDGDFDEANELAVSRSVTWTSTGQVPETQQTLFDIPAPGVDQTMDLEYRIRLFDSTIEPTNIATAYGGGASNGEVEDHIITVSELPVSISHVEARQKSEGVKLIWQTAMETGNAGFNIYLHSDQGLTQVNEDLIPSYAVYSQEPQAYEYWVSDIDDGTFYIEDVSVFDEVRFHGPFSTGEVFGEPIEADPIDWNIIRQEHNIKEDQRNQQRAFYATANQSFSIFNVEQIKPLRDSFDTDLVQNVSQINLIVNRDGIYRLAYRDLLKAGIDIFDIEPERLTLMNRGQVIPIHIEKRDYYKHASVIEFYGEALDSLYSNENVYSLIIDGKEQEWIHIDKSKPGGQIPEKYYMETAIVDDALAYNPLAINGDPWIYQEMRAYNDDLTWSFDLLVDDYFSDISAPPATLSVGMWGASDFLSIPGPNHHIQTKFNGQLVSDLTFRSVEDASFDLQLPDGLLQNGVNTLDFTQVTDTGATFNIVNLDHFSVTYPRELIARDGMLTFEAVGDVFQIKELPSNKVSVYKIVDGAPSKMIKIRKQYENSSFTATFAGSQSSAKYIVVTPDAYLKPEIEFVGPQIDITGQPADYAIISHPDFVSGLSELVDAREAQGFSVQIINVEDIYAQFSDYIFDAQAIKRYISFAVQNLGTTHFLLVGGDTYDYRGYLDSGGMSFIPSIYTHTETGKYFAPVDPMYVDVDDDGVPDAALGRFPVRNSDELAMMVNKTLIYEENVSKSVSDGGYAGQAVFAADRGFSVASNSFISNMPSGWNINTVYLDEVAVADARTELQQSINQGMAVTSFIGHSGDVVWSPSNILSASSVTQLSNFGSPTVVTQWGCWNTYFVEPAYNTMAHKFLVSGENGAAAVMGATTVSYASSERLLGDYMMPGLAQSQTTLGEALLAAKRQAAESSNSDLKDVLYGWTLLGDPGIVIQPQGE